MKVPEKIFRRRLWRYKLPEDLDKLLDEVLNKQDEIIDYLESVKDKS